ncbi:stretch-activated Ca2+-permeable channel component-domain-containing protein [Annulohypoxylon bovei var. microspora]|nr:stretch-activated Ca2+-permeable channel component-domain-containing protein [Annulohypoxylon bovei var. microspora]
MQLSPLQSRLAASVIASCLLIVIYLFLLSPQFALAAEFEPIFTDHDAPDLAYEIQDVELPEELDFRSSTYEPEFALFDRSIIGRVAENVASIGNNQVQRSNLAPGVTMAYVFLASSVSSRETQDSDEPLELRRSLNGSQEPVSEGHDDEEGVVIDGELARRATKTLWISANTCDQPWRISQTTMDPPQLTLYVSTSSDNTSPGPQQGTTGQDVIVFTEGAVMYNTTLDRDIYMSISAPSVSSEFFDTTKQYNFELVASTDEYYFSYHDDQTETDLVWVDSDATAALLQTNYLTNTSDQVLTTMPYVIFAHNQNNVVINGMRNSYCGLSSYAQIRNLDDGSSGMITMGLKNGGDKNLTRQEFYITGLNASSNYTGIIARAPGTNSQKRQASSSSTGGGIVFQPANFTTKPDGTCTFIFNMTFCDQTQYAVPGNLTNFPNGTVLAEFYDNYTRTMYDNFDKVMQQVPCETSSIAQYSLARDCDDCKAAYKNWICSVAVPRCEDFSSPDRYYLQIRNIASPFANGSFVNQSLIDRYGEKLAYNSSRNPIIDETVQPGPYKELLPCEDLCYELVRSCPSSMGFSCPRPVNQFGFSNSYGRDFGSGSLSCNYPGSAHFPAGADTLALPGLAFVGAASILFMVLL